MAPVPRATEGRGSKESWDVIVVGAGHAGCEAALAASRLGCSTLLLTINLDKIALMPCNPAVGGIGKGHLVREVDALGGEMGRNTDLSLIQIKTLNRSKGPAVRALRAQTDKRLYELNMKRALESQTGLLLRQDLAIELLVAKGRARGIKTTTGTQLYARAVVLATGTFLRGVVVIGDVRFAAGRMGDFASAELSQSLLQSGVKLGRFQSATPPRVDRRSLDLSSMKIQPGDEEPLAFSFSSPQRVRHDQLPCYLTYTNQETHRAVRRFLHLSPIKTGAISSKGPRFCPSIDRKVMNFPERERHPVFVEPEGRKTVEMYLQGLTTSLPIHAQVEIVHATPGLEEAKLMRPGYAVEYDYILPHQLKSSLECKAIEGLFSAGQINGTSGYEEAAAQGVVAGINAARYVKGRDPLILERSQAYIGVLIDDLVTKGIDEPYRMLTSRAEHRLLLRSDNADLRLTSLAHRIGLVSERQHLRVKEKAQTIDRELSRLARDRLEPEKANELLAEAGGQLVKEPTRLSDLLRRPEVSVNLLTKFFPRLSALPHDILSELEMRVKYQGYVERQLRQIRRQSHLEKRALPREIDYMALSALSYQAREALDRVKPRSLGQAGRVPGVSAADIAVLSVCLKQGRTPELRK